MSINIIKSLKRSNNVKLLLEKKAGHRLSEKLQLKKITDIIQEIKTEI